MTIEFYSLEQQDEFILNLFDHKTHGTFLDVSCSHPVAGSNTFTLENQFNWMGTGFDIVDINATHSWNKIRNSPFVQIDASSDQFTEYLRNNVPQEQVIDYVSLDVDGLSTVQALENIIKAGVKFKAVTFEHEFYLYNNLYRDAQRKILEDLGFISLFSDVRVLTANICCPVLDNDTESFEDWWVHPDYFDKNLLEIKASNLYYNQCVDLLKKFKNANYQSTHHCCRAFPEEYDLFISQDDRYQIMDVFNKMKMLNQNQGTL
jgi:hypothetical protein